MAHEGHALPLRPVVTHRPKLLQQSIFAQVAGGGSGGGGSGGGKYNLNLHVVG